MTQIPDSPETFARAFAQAWSARDAALLATMLVEDAEVLSLTGGWAEGRKAIEALFAGELAGSFSRSRLVTGKAKLRRLGPGAAVLHQRFVLSGLVGPDGQDMGRVGAILIAVLVAKTDGWQAVSAQFTAVDG